MQLFTCAMLSMSVTAKLSTLILRPPCLILRHSLPLSSSLSACRSTFFCTLRASPGEKYVYADPSPEFAELETHKFKVELFNKLSEDADHFGNDLHAVVDLCAQIFNEFLRKEYGGPGTLLVEPFTNMLVALKRMKLPGAPLAARASLLWAQNNVDEDWEVWNSKLK